MTKGDEWDLPDQEQAMSFLEDDEDHELEELIQEGEVQRHLLDHEQPLGLEEIEGWRFNEKCHCSDCHSLHATRSMPYPGCECFTCLKLDAHESAIESDQSGIWRFNPDCACERCLEAHEYIIVPNCECWTCLEKGNGGNQGDRVSPWG